MNELYATINFSKQKFILNGVDLISGDYNSTKIKFTFEDNQDKTKVIEIRPATSEDKNPTFMATITNNEVILTSKDDNDHNVTPFTTGGVYYMEISAYSNDSKLSTITKSFNVLEEQIILSDEIVSPYLPVFDELIEEIIKVTDEASNVNIDVTKNNNITTVTITNRDGVVKTVQILDGKDGKDGEDGEDGVGIESIEKISTSGLVDTYRITLTNNEHYDYEITNGNGIVSIEKTGTAGNIDTYTITYSNGTTSTFTVTNSEVTEEEFEELQNQVNFLSLYANALPKVTGTGTEVTLNDTANCPMSMSLRPSAISQDGTPTPENPQSIHTVSGNNTIEVVGKNLFDKNNSTILNAYVSTEAISGQDNKARLVIIPVNPNTTYTISKSNRGFDGSHQWMERIAEFSSVPTYSTPFIIKYNNVGMSYTFTTGSTTNYIAYGVAYGATYISNLQDYIDTIQLEKGTTATSYLPYTKQTLPLNLGTIELCKIGTYEDYFYKDNGKWYLKKNVLKTSDVIGSSSKTISDMVSNATVYSYCGGTVSGTTITYSSALTVENEIYYPTTTPTNTEITDTTLIGELEAIYNKATSYQDQTNITQVNNDLPFVITASAIYDLSNLLN